MRQPEKSKQAGNNNEMKSSRLQHGPYFPIRPQLICPKHWLFTCSPSGPRWRLSMATATPNSFDPRPPACARRMASQGRHTAKRARSRACASASRSAACAQRRSTAAVRIQFAANPSAPQITLSSRRRAPISASQALPAEPAAAPNPESDSRGHVTLFA